MYPIIIPVSNSNISENYGWGIKINQCNALETTAEVRQCLDDVATLYNKQQHAENIVTGSIILFMIIAFVVFVYFAVKD